MARYFLKETSVLLGFSFLLFISWNYYGLLIVLPLCFFYCCITRVLDCDFWFFIGAVYLLLLLFNMCVTSWLINVGIVQGALAMMLNAAFMSIPFAVLYFINRLSRTKCLFLIPLFWTTYELINQNFLLSWPWLSIGNAMGNQPHFVQWYSIIGVHGGTFWILLLSLLLYKLFVNQNKTKVFVLLLLLLLVPICISFCLYCKNTDVIGIVKVTTCIPNISTEGNLKKTKDLCRFLEQCEHENIVLFPELYFHPIIINKQNKCKDFNYLNMLLKQDTSYRFFIGAEVRGNNDKLYNTILVYDNDGVLIKTKRKYVPLTEYTPKLLRPIFGDSYYGYTDNDDFSVIGNKYQILPLLCYESVFSSTSTKLTYYNDVVFLSTSEEFMKGSSLGKKQYLNIVRIRAIESRRNIIKCSNKGFSAVINEKGEIVQKIDKVFQNVEAKRINRPSFYCKLLNFAFKE